MIARREFAAAGWRSVWSLASLLIVSFVLAPLPLARATETLPGGNSVTLPTSRTVDDDLMTAGNDVQILGTVNGDLMTAGGTVTLSGPVRDDILAAGGTVLLRGAVSDDVRAAGGTVILSGPVADNALLAGGSVTLDPAARVGRDAIVCANVARFNGSIQRNLDIYAGEATLSGEVGGNVHAEVGRLHVASGAVLRGDLTVVSERAPEIAPGAKVLGKVSHRLPTQPPPTAPQPQPKNRFLDWLIGSVLRYFGLLVLGVLAIALAPKGTSRLEGAAWTAPGRALLAGLVTLIVTPIAAFVLMLTVVGIPAGFALLCLYIAALLEAGVTAACAAGRWLRQKAGRPEGIPFDRLAWGAGALAVTTSLPWIGGILGLLVLLTGLGALALEIGQSLQNGSRPATISPTGQAIPATEAGKG